MSDLANAKRRIPFANGTEFDAWQSKWCAYCALDNNHDNAQPFIEGCPHMLDAILGEWPGPWLPEPDDGEHHLPSRLVCGAFTPDGEDPGAVERAARVATVTAYWEAKQ